MTYEINYLVENFDIPRFSHFPHFELMPKKCKHIILICKIKNNFIFNSIAASDYVTNKLKGHSFLQKIFLHFHLVYITAVFMLVLHHYCFFFFGFVIRYQRCHG